MPVKSDEEFYHRWTKDSFRKYVKENWVNIQSDRNRRTDLSAYWFIEGKCIHCGCPRDHYNMKVSPEPYRCSVCCKKDMTDEQYNHRMTMIAFVQDEIIPKGTEAMFAYVKRTLTHGFSLDPIELDKTIKKGGEKHGDHDPDNQLG